MHKKHTLKNKIKQNTRPIHLFVFAKTRTAGNIVYS